MARVLLAEDDPAIAEPLSRALAREGYDVSITDTRQAAIDAAAEVDLLIVDLSLPDLGGLGVAKEVRAAGNRVPILILTARPDEVDQLISHDVGADDYVTKPFRLLDLLARARELIRLGPGSSADRMQAQDVRVDKKARRAYRGTAELHLTNKEFDLLCLLLANAGAVVTKDQLMRDVWGNDPHGSVKTLDTHISWLRRKLGDDAGEPTYISAEPEVGFRFETSAA